MIENLFTRPPRLFVGSFQRPSIALSAIPRARDGLRQVRELVAARRGKSEIVYCATRETAETIADALAADGHRAASYHAGLSPEVRVARQDEFLARSDSVMAATIAFGLGVDKPDVRFIDPPDHLETVLNLAPINLRKMEMLALAQDRLFEQKASRRFQKEF